MKEAVVDTSVFIALETGRRLDTAGLPDEVLVSVVTVAELEAGVLLAPDVATRAARLRTAHAVSALRPLTIDDRCAATWARLFATLGQARRRTEVNDLWIASTAASLRVPLVTQDDDFDVLAELGLVEVVKV